MATNDIRSNIETVLLFKKIISSSGSVIGTVGIDTADYDLGLMFTMILGGYQDGDYTFQIQHSETASFITTELVPADLLIGSYPTLDSGSAESDTPIPTVGIFGNKRYVRVIVESSNVVNGSEVNVVVAKMAEVLPVVAP